MTRRAALDRLIATAALVGPISGCAAPLTAGERRRRALFPAMLTAWLIGLAVAWRWWGRPR